MNIFRKHDMDILENLGDGINIFKTMKHENLVLNVGSISQQNMNWEFENMRSISIKET